MASQMKLDAAIREETGKGVAGRLRRSGRVPATIYGLDRPTRSLHVDAVELYHALHTSAGMNVLIRLKAGEVEQLAMAKSVQQHPVRGDYLHIDFLRVDADIDVNIDVPVVTLGDESVRPGIVTLTLPALPVITRPLNVPDSIEVDVTGLSIGDSIQAGDLSLPDGVRLDIEAERTVVTIAAPTIEEVEEEEPAEGLEGEGIEGEPAADGEAADASAEEPEGDA